MTLPACLTVRSQVSSQMTPKYTSESLSSTLPISLDGILPANLALRSQVHSQEGRHFQSHLTLCSHVSTRSRDLLSCRRQAPGGVRLVAYGGQCLAGSVWHWRVAGGRQRMVAEIMTLVDIIVGTLSFARPPRRDLTMPHGHGVDTCSLRIRRKGRQFDLGESRSPTQIFQRNPVPTSH